MVDTKRDICLTSGSHQLHLSSDVQKYEKDLYLHRNHNKTQQFYFHLRPVDKYGKDKVVPLSAIMAERYLMKRGISCTEFPAHDAITRLYNWGYGIAEEF